MISFRFSFLVPSQFSLRQCGILSLHILSRIHDKCQRLSTGAIIDWNFKNYQSITILPLVKNPAKRRLSKYVPYNPFQPLSHSSKLTPLASPWKLGNLRFGQQTTTTVKKTITPAVNYNTYIILQTIIPLSFQEFFQIRQT